MRGYTYVGAAHPTFFRETDYSGSNILFKSDDDLNRTMTFSAVSSLTMANEIFSPHFLSFHIWKIHWISKL